MVYYLMIASQVFLHCSRHHFCPRQDCDVAHSLYRSRHPGDRTVALRRPQGQVLPATEHESPLW